MWQMRRGNVTRSGGGGAIELLAGRPPNTTTAKRPILHGPGSHRIPKIEKGQRK